MGSPAEGRDFPEMRRDFFVGNYYEGLLPRGETEVTGQLRFYVLPVPRFGGNPTSDL